MRIYAIIVTYNGLKWIDKCLQSVYNSRMALIPIVIDNSSTDGTVEFIRYNYPTVKLIESENNLGFGQANNIGLQLALKENVDYALLLNQDAWIEPDMIEILVLANQRNPNYWIVSPLQKHSINNRIELNFQRYLVDSNVIVDEMNSEVMELKFANAAVWLMSRQCIETVGGFDPLFPHYAEDNDYVRRVQFWGGKIGLVPLAIGYHDREIGYEVSIDKHIYKTTLAIIGLLKDVNNCLICNILKQIYKLTIKSVKYFHKRNFIDLQIYYISFYRSMTKITKICNARDKSMTKGAFIELDK